MTQKRVIDLNDGIAMVITDLHGAGEVYRYLRDRFLAGLARGSLDRFIICGDLIHSDGPQDEDASLAMLLDVMRLQAEYGRERVVMLLGNHEMPHIYGTTLARGDFEYTPRFEQSLARLDRQADAPFTRAAVIEFLCELPFYARTRSGVLLSHAGAATQLVVSAERLQSLLDFDHRRVLRRVDERLKQYDLARLREHYADAMGEAYDALARYYLGVTEPDNPRYNDFLRNMFVGEDADFNLLWGALFTRNEYEEGEPIYERVTGRFLELMSQLGRHEQRVLVAGHIAVKDGFTFVGSRQLRFASYAHAKPPEAARYLLLDCAEPVYEVGDLEPGLRHVFER